MNNENSGEFDDESDPEEPERPEPEGGEEPARRRGCRACGEPLTYAENKRGDVVGTCEACGESFTFTLTPVGGEAQPMREERRRPRGFSGGRPAPGARGCRQCGAPLQFSTNEDGSVTGSCTGCNNQFTLPPRSDGPRGGGYRDRGGGGYGRGPPRQGGWGSGGGGRSGGGGGYYRGGRSGGSGGSYSGSRSGGFGGRPRPPFQDRKKKRRENNY